MSDNQQPAHIASAQNSGPKSNPSQETTQNKTAPSRTCDGMGFGTQTEKNVKPNEPGNTSEGTLRAWGVVLLLMLILLAGIGLEAGYKSLVILTALLALIGIFPVSYWAYQQNRRGVQIKRLATEFHLLGLTDQEDTSTVEELYDRVNNPLQYILFIVLVVAVSLFILTLYAPYSPVGNWLLAPAPANEKSEAANVPPSDATSLTAAPSAAQPQAAPTLAATNENPPGTPNAWDRFVAHVLSIVSPKTAGAGSIVPPNQPATPKPDQKAMEIIELIFVGYLGAYVYSIQELVRRFNTFDLRPQVYSSILVRMLAAIVLVFVGASAIFALGAGASSEGSAPVPSSGYAVVWGPAIIAFVIGSFPSRGVRWFTKLADRVLGPSDDAASASQNQLENLLGISTWHASRLEQTGIDDAQNLAAADIRKLLLTTQFDPQVIVNWIDQAILYVKVGSKIGNFRDAQITTFSEFENALSELKNSEPADQRETVLAKAAASLLGGNATTLQLTRMADYSNFPNYNHISEYYARAGQVAHTYATEGMRSIVNLAPYGGFDEAIAQGEQSLRLLGQRADAELYIEVAKAYYGRGARRKTEGDALAEKDIECAIAYASKSMEKDRDDIEAYYVRGQCYIVLKQYDKAIRDYSRVISLDRGHARAYHDRGVAYHRLNQPTDALRDLDEALRLNDRLAEAYYSRGDLHLGLGIAYAADPSKQNEAATELQVAMDDLEKAYLTRYMDEGAVRLAMGTALLENKRYAEAVSELSRALELLDDSGTVSAYLKRSAAYSRLNRIAEARSDLETVIRKPTASKEDATMARQALANLMRAMPVTIS